MTDTLFPDVSEFQVPVDDSMPYRIFSFRSNDGSHRDANFEANYRWACAAADSGKIDCFIVYVYVRPNWQETADTHIDMVSAAGGPHPKMISMLDVESGGNPAGDGSDWINRTYWRIAAWLGTSASSGTRRVIGYANAADFATMWPTRPDGLRVIGAGYGSNPELDGQIAHQYTDGQGYGAGLPEGCSPFGQCDMNSADGLSPTDFAAACGIGAPMTQPQPTPPPPPPPGAPAPLDVKFFSDFMFGYVGPVGSDVKDIRAAVLGGRDKGDDGGKPQGGYRTLYDLVAAIAARLGVPGAVDTNPTGAAPTAVTIGAGGDGAGVVVQPPSNS